MYSMRITLFLLISTISGCSIDINISRIGSAINGSFNPNEQRNEPDFVVGEVVTTNNGVVITGSFGEISEKKNLPNGVAIEGAFYE